MSQLDHRLAGGFNMSRVVQPQLGLAARASLAWAVLRSKAVGDFNWQAHNLRAFDTSLSQAPSRSTTALLTAYCVSPWLRAVVSKLRSSVGSTTWRLYAPVEEGADGRRRYRRLRRYQRGVWQSHAKSVASGLATGSMVEVEDHPFFSALQPSGSTFAGLDVIGLAQAYLELLGEAFLVKRRNYDYEGAPVDAVFPVPPTWVQRVPSVSDPFYWLNVPGATPSGLAPATSGGGSWSGPIRPEDMIYLKVANPGNPYGRGYGHAGAVSDEIESDEYAAKHVKSWFYNRARPDLIITVEGAKDDDREPLELKWRQKMQGFWKAFQPFFVNRKIDVHEIGQNFQQMELTNLRKFERDVVLQVWGMPPEAFGIVENSNRATINAADYLLGKWVLVPRLEYLRAVLQVTLVEEYDERLILGYDSPVAEDAEFTRSVMVAVPEAFRVDEWRDLVGRKPIGGVLGLSAVTRFNMAYKPLVAEDEDVPVPAVQPVLPAGGSPGASAGHRAGCSCGGHPAPKAGGAPYLMLAKSRLVDPRPILALVDDLKPGMRDQVLAAIEGLRGEVDPDALEAALAEDDLDEAYRLLNPEGLSAKLAGFFLVLRQALVVAGEEHARTLAEALDAEVEFPSGQALDWLADHQKDLGDKLTKTTAAAVVFALQWAHQSGLSPRSQTRALIDLLGLNEPQAKAALNMWDAIAKDRGPGAADKEVAAYILTKRNERAAAIAEDEVPAVTNQAGQETWLWAVAAGLLTMALAGKEWITEGDERVCDTCGPMEGAVVPLTGTWTTAVGELETPSDAHPTCRCTQGLVLL